MNSLPKLECNRDDKGIPIAPSLPFNLSKVPDYIEPDQIIYKNKSEIKNEFSFPIVEKSERKMTV